MTPSFVAVAELEDGRPTELALAAATAARGLAAAAGGTACCLVVAAEPADAAAELAHFVPDVVAVADPRCGHETQAPLVVQAALQMLDQGANYLVVPASATGRDVVGYLVGLRGLGVLANAEGVEWDGATVRATGALLGGAQGCTSPLTTGTGAVLLAAGSTTAQPSGAQGGVRTLGARSSPIPPVAVVASVLDSSEVALEDARVIVVGGRGVGGADGFRLVKEIADGLGGVVGATRAAVDAGWVPYARQIGQTGRTVHPDVYLGLGVSLATQHRMGMRNSGTVIVVNTDPDAPAGDVADLYIQVDLFEFGSAFLAALRARG